MKVYQLVGEIADFDYKSETFGFRICGPASLKKFLDGCKKDEKVEIEINSPGGLCIPGMEMANAIKNSDAHVIAHITGMAASMASVIACACDEIKMEEASFMMIHDPWSGVEGNAAAMRKEAMNLDQFKAVIMSFYRGKFNRTPEEISALMSDETWMTGAECVENGLTCELIKSDVKVAALVGSANFARMPEAAAALYQFKELSDEAKAEIEKAKAEQAATAAAPTPASPTTGTTSPTAATDYEARFKGASKKINELMDQLKAKDDEIAASKKAVVDLSLANEQIKDLTDKLEKANKDLADANASVSKLNGELEQMKMDLAKAGEHAKHLESINATIVGNVLVPSNADDGYEAKMKNAKSAKEREDLRKQKASGKIK